MAWLDILDAVLTIALGPAPKPQQIMDNTPLNAGNPSTFDVVAPTAPVLTASVIPTDSASGVASEIPSSVVDPVEAGTTPSTRDDATQTEIHEPAIPTSPPLDTLDAKQDTPASVAAFKALNLPRFEPFKPVILYSTPPRAKRAIPTFGTIDYDVALLKSANMPPFRRASPLAFTPNRCNEQPTTYVPSMEMRTLDPTAQPFAYPSLISFPDTGHVYNDASTSTDLLEESNVTARIGDTSNVPNISVLEEQSMLKIDYRDLLFTQIAHKPNPAPPIQDSSNLLLRPATLQDQQPFNSPSAPELKRPRATTVFQRAMTGIIKQASPVVPRPAPAVTKDGDVSIVENVLAVIAKVEQTAPPSATKSRVLHTPRPLRARIGNAVISRASPRIANPLRHPARPAFLAESTVKIVLRKPDDNDEAVVVEDVVHVEETASKESVKTMGVTVAVEQAILKTPKDDEDKLFEVNAQDDELNSNLTLSSSIAATIPAVVPTLAACVQPISHSTFFTPTAKQRIRARVGRMFITRDSPRIENPLSHPGKPAYLSQSTVKVVLRKPDALEDSDLSPELAQVEDKPAPSEEQKSVETEVVGAEQSVGVETVPIATAVVESDESDNDQSREYLGAAPDADLTLKVDRSLVLLTEDQPGDVFSASLADPVIHLPVKGAKTKKTITGVGPARIRARVAAALPAALSPRKTAFVKLPSSNEVVAVTAPTTPFEQNIKLCPQLHTPPKLIQHATHSYVPEGVSLSGYKERVSVFADAAKVASQKPVVEVASVEVQTFVAASVKVEAPPEVEVASAKVEFAVVEVEDKVEVQATPAEVALAEVDIASSSSRWETVARTSKPAAVPKTARHRTTSSNENPRSNTSKSAQAAAKGLSASMWSVKKQGSAHLDVVPPATEIQTPRYVGKRSTSARKELAAEGAEDKQWWRKASSGRKAKESLLSPPRLPRTALGSIGAGRWHNMASERKKSAVKTPSRQIDPFVGRA